MDSDRITSELSALHGRAAQLAHEKAMLLSKLHLSTSSYSSDHANPVPKSDIESSSISLLSKIQSFISEKSPADDVSRSAAPPSRSLSTAASDDHVRSMQKYPTQSDRPASFATGTPFHASTGFRATSSVPGTTPSLKKQSPTHSSSASNACSVPSDFATMTPSADRTAAHAAAADSRSSVKSVRSAADIAQITDLKDRASSLLNTLSDRDARIVALQSALVSSREEALRERARADDAERLAEGILDELKAAKNDLIDSETSSLTLHDAMREKNDLLKVLEATRRESETAIAASEALRVANEGLYERCTFLEADVSAAQKKLLASSMEVQRLEASLVSEKAAAGDLRMALEHMKTADTVARASEAGAKEEKDREMSQLRRDLEALRAEAAHLLEERQIARLSAKDSDSKLLQSSREVLELRAELAEVRSLFEAVKEDRERLKAILVDCGPEVVLQLRCRAIVLLT